MLIEWASWIFYLQDNFAGQDYCIGCPRSKIKCNKILKLLRELIQSIPINPYRKIFDQLQTKF